MGAGKIIFVLGAQKSQSILPLQEAEVRRREMKGTLRTMEESQQIAGEESKSTGWSR